MFSDTALWTFARAGAVTAVSAAVLFGVPGSGVQARADSAVAPKSGSVTVSGAGWGHGKGMSQWGAYGAASKGLDYAEIIDFYYPGTSLDELPDGNTIRVWITADSDNGLHVRPVKGQVVSDSAGTKVTLPYGSKYTKWRISRSGSKRVLYYRNADGNYVKYSNKLNPERVWTVSNPTTNTVKLAMPDGATRTYRGTLAARFAGSGMKTVNELSMESYLRGVVPAEMPATWAIEAVKAQSVAARTYAAKLRSVVSDSATYDLCDTSACQVYKGVAAEYSASDKAIAATKDKVVEYKNKLALTMFSASNGGWSASGGSGYSYLKAQKDPYDGVRRDQSWSVTLSSSKIQKAYPAVGTLKAVQVTARDGDGTYGGRVEEVRIAGSKATVTVTGSGFKSKFGLKERLFKLTGGSSSMNLVTTTTPTASTTATPTPTPSPTVTGVPTAPSPTPSPNSTVTPTTTGTTTVKPTATPTATGTAKPTATATPTPTPTPTATASPTLSGAVLKAYKALGTSDSSTLGKPRTAVITTSTGTYADFALGRITCPTGKECIVSFG